jgi:hypothetical protein
MEEPTDVSAGMATMTTSTPITAQRMNFATFSYAFVI